MIDTDPNYNFESPIRDSLLKIKEIINESQYPNSSIMEERYENKIRALMRIESIVDRLLRLYK